MGFASIESEREVNFKEPLIEVPLLSTVWKFHDFSNTQIVHEISFEDSSGAKSAIFYIQRPWIVIFAK